jgi:membrane dipeptidase
MTTTTFPALPLVDGHLDLAENVTLFGRDLTRGVSLIRQKEKRQRAQAMVSLPELARGEIAVTFATVTGGFKVEDVGKDFQPASAIYHNQQEAQAHALKQLELYEHWEHLGLIRIIRSVTDLEHHLQLWQTDRVLGVVLLMEGADPIVEVNDLRRWWQRGLRMIGLTFGDTRYGVGVGSGNRVPKTGGLTPEGLGLLEAMAEQGFIWDISHLSEAAIYQGLAMGYETVCASHANARALIPTDRHLSDEIIRVVASRGGVIGLVLYDGFLEPSWYQNRGIPVTLAEHLTRQADYVAKLVGWQHIGIGSDLDGGFGLEESPEELDTIADLYTAGNHLPTAVRDQVLSTNWLDFLRRSLPG